MSPDRAAEALALAEEITARLGQISHELASVRRWKWLFVIVAAALAVGGVAIWLNRSTVACQNTKNQQFENVVRQRVQQQEASGQALAKVIASIGNHNLTQPQHVALEHAWQADEAKLAAEKIPPLPASACS